MRIVRNVGHVKRRKRIARLTALLGFVMLGSTFLLIFFPTQLIVAYGLLLIGFISFNFGMQQMGKWSNTPRHPRNDLAIDERVSGFSDKYAVLHYMKIGKGVIEHIVICPGSLLVLTARDVPGGVIGSGSRWRRKGLGFTRMFGMSGPQLGNPSLETDQAISALETVLKDAQLEYDLYGAILFTAPTVVLDVEDTDYPAILTNELDDFIRDIPAETNYKTTQTDQLIQLLAQGEELERTERVSTRRPVRVKRRAMGKS